MAAQSRKSALTSLSQGAPQMLQAFVATLDVELQNAGKAPIRLAPQAIGFAPPVETTATQTSQAAMGANAYYGNMPNSGQNYYQGGAGGYGSQGYYQGMPGQGQDATQPIIYQQAAPEKSDNTLLYVILGVAVVAFIGLFIAFKYGQGKANAEEMQGGQFDYNSKIANLDQEYVNNQHGHHQYPTEHGHHGWHQDPHQQQWGYANY